jgi:outer membrane protein assembly factor BamB
VHAARQIRLVVSFLLLFALIAPAAHGAPQSPVPPQTAPARGRLDPKKEAKKRPPLSTTVEWSVVLRAPASAFPGYDLGQAYVPLQSGHVAAVALQGGAIAWTVEVGPTGSPAAGNGLVFLPVAGAIEAREAATGAVRWRVDMGAPLSVPPVWQNGWLLAGTDRETAIMLRAETGERLWERALGGRLREGVAMTGDRIYVPLVNGHVKALALATGETIWDRTLGTEPTAITPLDDRIFVGGQDKFFYCLSAANGKTKWKWRTGGAIVGTPAVDEDNVYFLSLDNVLRALDRGNGFQAWHTGVPFRPSAGPFLEAGLLLVSGLAQIAAYQPVDGSAAGSTDIPEVLAAPPHFLAAGAAGPPFVVVTRDGQIALMAPQPPPLESKPFPPKPIYPLWPADAALQISTGAS